MTFQTSSKEGQLIGRLMNIAWDENNVYPSTSLFVEFSERRIKYIDSVQMYTYHHFMNPTAAPTKATFIQPIEQKNTAFDFDNAFSSIKRIGKSMIVNADCFDWLTHVHENSLHGMVTDPPYGVKEYEVEQLEKMANGQGGIWRIPPSFDGHTRSPLPRFTALNKKERAAVSIFFHDWAELVLKALRPGGHIFIATNAFISQLLYQALVDGGLEFRGEVIRLVMTLRGGDRPKNAEEEFPDVCSMPRGCFEPWGIFRKPMLPGMKVSDCLKEYGTGGLRRRPDNSQFFDVIESERTSQKERLIADHPSLKPQSFLRQLVHAVLPLGEGIIADPFMGSGSTVAAAEAMGLQCIGIERYANYYNSAEKNIRGLAALHVPGFPPTRQLFNL